MKIIHLGICLSMLGAFAGSTWGQNYDIVIRNGTIYDGSGSAGYQGDVAIQGDRIAAVGDLGGAQGTIEIFAEGMAVAPGFINIMSWSNEALFIDGRSQSEIRQGVTTEIMGEGFSWGPFNGAMKQDFFGEDEPLWTTLDEYLEFLAGMGVSPNVASFVGATTVRIHEIGENDREPTPEELDRMCELVREAMEDGAVGISTALIYPPSSFAKTDELIELSKAASEYGGIYISHMRSEANGILAAIDELITIAQEANIPAEIYHFKIAGQSNWDLYDTVVQKIETAQNEGLRITANMYPYTAGGTGLTAILPPWVQDGGDEAMRERIADPLIREQIKEEILTPTDEWENMYLAVGSAENILFSMFQTEALKPLSGKSLAEVSATRGTSPLDTAMDMILEDNSRIEVIYIMMSEENLSKQIALPWVGFSSDAPSIAPEGGFLESMPHPRAYGSFARVLGKYVRDEKVIPLEEAIRKLTSMPAETLKLDRRGRLEPGFFADVTVFNPDSIRDMATYTDPHQYSTGVEHVFVNGVQVLKDGEHTNARPGRVVRGPGWIGRTANVTDWCLFE